MPNPDDPTDLPDDRARDWHLWPHPALYHRPWNDSLDLYSAARAARARSIGQLICAAVGGIAAVARSVFRRPAEY
jgi:hypothetical protein